jgi:glycosyltransferase involved in cell wall biosynthesis
MFRLLGWFVFQVQVILPITTFNLRKYDLLYAYEIEAVPVLKLLSMLYRKKLITRFQGTIVKEHVNFIMTPRLIPHYIALRTPSSLTIMTDDGTGGDKILKAIRKKEGRVEFLKNGIDEIFFKIPRRVRTAGAPLNIFTCGRLVGWKNHDKCIRAFSLALQRTGSIRLFVLGGGPEMRRLECLIRELSLRDYVLLMGHLNPTELIKTICDCDVYLTSYEHSNVGKTLMEAMASGKAILATDTGETSRFILHEASGILCPPNDMTCIATQIVRLEKDRALVDSLGVAARISAAESFSPWSERLSYEQRLLESLANC